LTLGDILTYLIDIGFTPRFDLVEEIYYFMRGLYDQGNKRYSSGCFASHWPLKNSGLLLRLTSTDTIRNPKPRAAGGLPYHFSHFLDLAKSVPGEIKLNCADILEPMVTIQSSTLLRRLEIARKTNSLGQLDPPFYDETSGALPPVLRGCYQQRQDWLSLACGPQPVVEELELTHMRILAHLTVSSAKVFMRNPP
jgi:hypothetical protein